MLNNHPQLKQALSLLLSFAVVLPASLGLVGDNGTAEAAASYNYIEKVKAGTAFRILEVVPQDNAYSTISEGSVGYYIAGQEPCRSFAEDAEKYALTLNNANNMTMRRTNYVRSVFNNLKALGIMGEKNSAATENPLTLVEDYEEKYPWQLDSITDPGEKSKYAKQLILSTPDAVSDRDHFIKASVAGGGKFNISSNFIIPTDASVVPNYVQIIDRFTNNADQMNELTGTVYAYAPTFAKASEAQLGSGEGALDSSTPLYVNKKDSGESTVDSYVYVGTKASTPLEEGETYYYVADTGRPTPATVTSNADGTRTVSLPAGTTYAAVSTAYRSVNAGETAYFAPEGGKLQYAYVGSGGAYNYDSTKVSSTEVTILTPVVYYKGGFLNNNWFLRYVLDCEESDGSLTMPSVNITLDCATPEKIVKDNADDKSTFDVDNYDMIVLSCGQKQNSSAATAYTSEKDLSAEVRAQIIRYAKGSENDVRRAVIVDSRLSNCPAPNIKDICSTLNSYVGSQYVKGSSFVFHSDNGNYKSFATKAFKETLNDSSRNHYTEVSELIEKTKKIWEASDSSRKMSDEVAKLTLAHVVRHIITASEPLNVKKSLHILDIEPAKSYGAVSKLNAATINDWAGKSDYYSIDAAHSKLLSTAEFIGTIDDLGENYDLIYIGSDISGFNKTTDFAGNDIINYYDDDMDGLVYTNIGDKVVSGGASGFNLSGLLDRDYASTPYRVDGKDYYPLATGYYTLAGKIFDITHFNDTTRTFRYSGNDLTAQAVERLKNYASIGHPVVVAGDLRSGYDKTANAIQGSATFEHLLHTHSCDYSVSASLSGTTLTANFSTPDASWDGDLSSKGYVSSFINYWEMKSPSGTTFSRVSADSSLNTSAYPDGSQFRCVMTATEIDYGFDASREVIKNTSAVSQTVIFYKNSVNQAKVDNSSYMYKFLYDTIETPTVFETGNLTNEKKADFNTYLGIEPPTLRNYTGPAEYSEAALADASKSIKSLDYTFTITDTVNAGASYTAHLYVDTNGDGQYKENEELDSVSVSTADSGDAVSPARLKVGVQYKLSRALPSTLTGIIPWKLQLVQNGNPAVRVTKSGYSHVSGTPQTINVLQVQSSGATKNGATNLSTDKEYRDYFDKIQKDFIINVFSLDADDLNSTDRLSAKVSRGYSHYSPDPTRNSQTFGGFLKAKNAAVENGDKWTVKNLDAVLNSFDMLILGFADSYDGLDQEAVGAISRYIDTGKAVLFTHDCTSFYNLPAADYRTENYPGTYRPRYAYGENPSGYSGYTFNTEIRSIVGLDRYGVVDSSYGRTRKSNPSLGRDSGTVANSYKGAELNAIANAGYTVAYKPKSNKTQTVPETQGLTSNILTRYYKDGVRPYGYNSADYDGFFGNILEWIINALKDEALDDNELQKTTSVRQVNQGVITTYPYNVNTSEFGNPAQSALLTVGQTHMQYYQLNLNRDDIVVWYCLAGGSQSDNPLTNWILPNTYDYMTNDVTNQYYIYSRGNVTYSGAGHSVQTAAEKKLFVNTMVAAFRPVQAAPIVEITDSTGTKAGVTSIYLPADDGYLKASGFGNDTNRNIYFKLQNTSLGNDSESVSYGVALTYKTSDKDGAKALNNVSIYDGSLPVGSTSDANTLTAGSTYYIRLDEIARVLGPLPASTVITITPSKTINGTTTLVGEPVSVTLRQMPLFDLG